MVAPFLPISGLLGTLMRHGLRVDVTTGVNGTLATLPFDDEAERRALLDLTASLEPLVDDAFSGTYSEAIAAARNSVRQSPV